MTYQEFAELALALPETHEKVGKVECDLFRDGRHMARLRDKKRAIAIRLPWDLCDKLLSDRPDLFFVTPHYNGYPYVLAWIEALDSSTAEQLLRAAWEAAPDEIPVHKAPKL